MGCGHRPLWSLNSYFRVFWQENQKILFGSGLSRSGTINSITFKKNVV